MAMSSNGFTLPDLLIALLILGIIAAFSIPKILNSSLSNSEKSVALRNISQLETLFRNGWQSKEIGPSTSGTNLWNYLTANVNTVKVCSSNSLTEGCRTASIPDSTGGNENTNPGAVLHDGSFILFWGKQTQGTCQVFTFFLDVNNDDPPNSRSGTDADVLELKFNLDPTTTCSGYRPGTLKPHPTSVSAYQRLFQAP